MSKFLVFAICALFIWYWFTITKDYPQCRFSGDPVMCVELAKQIGK